MSKRIIKVVIGSKKIVKKIDLETKLDKFREILKDSMPGNCFFMMEDAIIEKNDEQNFVIKDIEKNNQVLCSLNTTSINIFLNDKNILKHDINIDENIEILIKELNGKIPANSTIKFDDTELTIEEAKNEEMTIKDISSDNSIYFIHKENIKGDDIKEKNNTLKIKENSNENNSFDNKNSSEKLIHIFKNGDVIKMGLFDININLEALRNLIKDKISDKARFLSEGVGVPINDEKCIKLYHIIKEDKIYIEESDNKTKSRNFKKEEEKEKIEKMTIFLKLNENSSSIIKAFTSEKLDKIREQNQSIIKDNYCFTLQGCTISKDQENTFSIGEIMDNSHIVLLRNIRPKIKIQIMEDNKSVKSEFDIDPLEKLSRLRKELSIESSKAFTKNSSEIDIENEDILTIADIQLEGKINIVEKSLKFTIFVNNNQILKESYSPTITVANLRTYLLMHIPKDCSFIHANKQTPIPPEIEDTITISKICDEKNNIFIESEEKKNISKNKPLDEAKFLRKEGELEIYLFPSRKYIIGKQNSSQNEKSECLNISKQINRKILMVVGQTGSGKTTLLNSLINALCGIQLHDNFRYIIIDEYAKDSGVDDPKTQSKSRTSYVTAYNIDGINGNPPITIIDTPGFGDSRGMKFDEKIIEMIRDLFKNWIDSVNGICFVASASSARLTSTQKYIFSSIVSLFGNDIAENFIPMLTFCDGKEPQILASLLDNESTFKKSIYDHIKNNNPWYLQFNNSAIFESNRTGKFTELFWELGMDSFKLFFTKLNLLSTKSLNHSKSVLETREKMQNKILALRPLLDQGLSLIEAMKNEINQIKINTDLINKTRNFKIKTKRPKITKENLRPGIHTTTCLKCNFTCHNNCSFANNKDKKNCCAMDYSGYCHVCPNKCYWEQHTNVPYIIKYSEIEVEETVEELKKKYFDSNNKLSLSEQIIRGKELELEKKMVECYYIQDEIKICINKLKKEALYPNVNETAEEYIDLQIESERTEKKAGYKDRIKTLESIKQNNKLINQMFLEGTTCRSFEEFRREVMEGKISFIEGKNCSKILTKEEKDRLCIIF